jgi:hypothetical protein
MVAVAATIQPGFTCWWRSFLARAPAHAFPVPLLPCRRRRRLLGLMMVSCVCRLRQFHPPLGCIEVIAGERALNAVPEVVPPATSQLRLLLPLMRTLIRRV